MKLPSHISYLLGLIGVAICAGIAAALILLAGCSTCQWTRENSDATLAIESKGGRIWTSPGAVLVIADVPSDPTSILYTVKYKSGMTTMLRPAYKSDGGPFYKWSELPDAIPCAGD